MKIHRAVGMHFTTKILKLGILLGSLRTSTREWFRSRSFWKPRRASRSEFRFVSASGPRTLDFDSGKARRGEPQTVDEMSKRKALRRYLPTAQECPHCNAGPELLRWEYYTTPASTWRFGRNGGLCGRAGWMTACEKCGQSVDFFVEQMS